MIVYTLTTLQNDTIATDVYGDLTALTDALIEEFPSVDGSYDCPDTLDAVQNLAADIEAETGHDVWIRVDEHDVSTAVDAVRQYVETGLASLPDEKEVNDDADDMVNDAVRDTLTEVQSLLG